MGNYKRPWCCPERRCAVLYQSGGPPNPEKPGESWVCFGRMPELVEFVYDGEYHHNDLTSCHFTPLKGLIRFQENATDWALAAFSFANALWLLKGRPKGYKPDRWRYLKMPANSAEEGER